MNPEITLRTYPLLSPFRIAHGTSQSRTVVRITWRGAVGEGPFIPYYKETPEEALAWLAQVDIPALAALFPNEAARRAAALTFPGISVPPRAARLALDILLQDLAAKSDGIPLWNRWSERSFPLPRGCRALGIPSNMGEHREAVREAARRFPVLKLKTGSGNLDFDEAIISVAREAAPSHSLCVDANCGWSPRDSLKLLPAMNRAGILFLEQPVGRDGLEPWCELRSRWPVSAPPLIADESIQSEADIIKLHFYADGVNLKLVKFGSLPHTLCAMKTARSLGMRVLLGCMVEGAVGVTAAAHLAPLADDIDLDGHLYLAEDDYSGAWYDGSGQLHLPQGEGLGCESKEGHE